MSASIVEHFAPVSDPRVERNKLYPLMEILLLVVCAMLSGAEGWEAIEEFGKEKLSWLRKFAPFANGIPSHDCIATLISRLNPKTFQACFVSWARAISTLTEGEIVAVDGKSALGSRDRRRGKAALGTFGGQARIQFSNHLKKVPRGAKGAG